jgi:hypothetical protein
MACLKAQDGESGKCPAINSQSIANRTEYGKNLSKSKLNIFIFEVPSSVPYPQ